MIFYLASAVCIVEVIGLTVASYISPSIIANNDSHFTFKSGAITAA